MSNFLIKGGTKYEIAGVYETFNYVTETEVKSIKDIIGSNVPANFVSSDFPIIIWTCQSETKCCFLCYVMTLSNDFLFKTLTDS